MSIFSLYSSLSIPIHGNQEGKHFHGYYDENCFLPLYVFSEGHLLSARLRTSDCDPLDGVLEDICRIVERLRWKWPGVRIIVRGDSGFCREELMGWCESLEVDYVLGPAKNPRLERMIKKDLKRAKRKFKKSGRAARRFRNLKYRTLRTWSRKRRVVAKAEHLSDGPNPRFVVTIIEKSQTPARALYEDLYCARDNMENRIKMRCPKWEVIFARALRHTNQAYGLWEDLYRIIYEVTRAPIARPSSPRNLYPWTLLSPGSISTIAVATHRCRWLLLCQRSTRSV